MTQLLTCLALAASGALWVHHQDPRGSGFCAQNSGCESVRESPLSGFFDDLVPLPVLGMVAYLIVLALSCPLYDRIPVAVSFGPLSWQSTIGWLRCFTILGKFVVTMLALIPALASVDCTDWAISGNGELVNVSIRTSKPSPCPALASSSLPLATSRL